MPSERINTPNLYVDRTWATQPKPYTSTLGYKCVRASGALSETIIRPNQPNVVRSKPLVSPYYCRLNSPGWYIGAAKNRALSDLLSDLQKAQVGNNLGQSRQAYDMIAKRAFQIASAYRSVRKGNLNRAAEILGVNKPKRSRAKTASGLWLEYTYGWKPLVQDVYAAVNTVKPAVYTICRGRGRVSVPINEPNPHGGGTINGTILARARSGAIFKNLSTVDVLQLNNPAQVAWELLPFSFVADWFLPIGTWIGLQSPAFNSKIVRSYVSVKTTASLSLSGSDDFGSFSMKYSGNDSGVSLQRESALSPSATFDRSFFNGSSPHRAANAIALLVQQFRR